LPGNANLCGGYGYAKEYDVEWWWREVNMIRLAPVTQEMTLNYIGEHIPVMPKSYLEHDIQREVYIYKASPADIRKG